MSQLYDAIAQLAPKIDRDGLYPSELLQQLGQQEGFSIQTAQGPKVDLAHGITCLAKVGEACGSTAFLAWCQTASAWYLQNSLVAETRARYFSSVATAQRLAGTGMSNTLKHLAGIERLNLKATKQKEGYVVTGALPWVSNLGEDNLIIATAAVDTGGYLIFVAECSNSQLELRLSPEFSGMNGTATYSVRYKDVFVAPDQVVAGPEQFKCFIRSIKPGFLLLQCGFALGVVEACIARITESNTTHEHVNRFLDSQGADLEEAKEAALALALDLAQENHLDDGVLLKILKLRAHVAELCLQAANSAVLHAGARGYSMRDSAQRLLREAVFISIVTPALKHLKKEIYNYERHYESEQLFA